MENYFGLVAAVVLVVIVAVAFAIASNRADEATSANKQRNKQKSNKDKQKSNKKGKQKNKPLPNVVFKSDGKVENEDESMIDLIQGTAKYYAQEAKQASDAAAKKLQAAAAETKATADKAVKGAKNAAKKTVAAVEEQLDEAIPYTSVSRPRNNTRAKPETKEPSGENVVPQFSGKKKGNKPFLKSEKEQQGQPGEKRQKREKKQNQDSTENAGDKPAVDGEAKPQRQRTRPPRQENDATKTEGEVAVEGEEDRRPRQPRGPPKEPREKKPLVFQPIPQALALDTNDVLSKKNLDEMLGYMSSHYRTQETVFSRLAEVSSQRIARDTRRYKDQAVAKKLRPVNTLSGEQIIVKILSKCSLRDIIAVSQVDQFFSKITRGDALWKALGARDFGIAAKENKDNKDKQKKDNKKPPRAKALYRDKYDESKGRKTAKPAAKPKSSDSPKTEVNKPAAAANGSPAEEKTQKKGEKKKKDTTA